MGERVHQEDETKLKGTVTQAAKDRTVTGEVDIGDVSKGTQTNDVEVTPGSGADLAREHYYDRNPAILVYDWNISSGNHANTVRWTYTVPTGRKAMHSFIHEHNDPAINDAGTAARTKLELYDGSAWSMLNICVLNFGDGSGVYIDQSAPFIMIEDNIIRGLSYNSDSINHYNNVTCILTEFDE